MEMVLPPNICSIKTIQFAQRSTFGNTDKHNTIIVNRKHDIPKAVTPKVSQPLLKGHMMCYLLSHLVIFQPFYSAAAVQASEITAIMLRHSCQNQWFYNPSSHATWHYSCQTQWFHNHYTQSKLVL